MDNKTCTVCNIEIHISSFHKKYSEYKDCNIRRAVKRYVEYNDRSSIQKITYHEKNRDELFQKQNDYRDKRNTDFTELHRFYVELQKKIKTL